MKFWVKNTDRASRIEVLSLIGIGILVSLGLVFMWRAGAAARAYIDGPPRIYEIGNESESYTVLAATKVRGRVLIHFSRHLPMAPRSRGTNASITNDNYLYAACADNLVRKIYGVIPDDAWEEARAKLKRVKSAYTVTDDHIIGRRDGTPITAMLAKDLPAIAEPVVLNFSRDYFASPKTTPQRVFGALRAANLKYDLAVIALPDPRDPDYERTKARIAEFQYYTKEYR